MSVYSTTLRLRNKDVNLHRLLRTATLFELMQEASIRHTEELGMGREMTLDRGLLWMVTLQRAEISRMPAYDETITLESWPGETMHLLFPRYYRVLDEAGNTLVSSSALWALVDQETRRMIFPDRYGVHVEGCVTGHEIELPSPPRKAQGGEASRFTVPFSYLDLNGHMNNTRYLDLAEDLIPAAAEGRALREIQVEYSSEARLGDSLSVTVEQDGGRFFVSGETEKKIFRMCMSYA